MFRTVPVAIIKSFSLYTQQWYVSYMSADSLLSANRYDILKSANMKITIILPLVLCGCENWSLMLRKEIV